MPDVEKKRLALLLAVVADIDTGFDLLVDDPAQCRLANPVELSAHAMVRLLSTCSRPAVT